MGRWLTWNDEYCPEGHEWQFVGASSLFPDYYYCPKCDQLWEPTVRKLSFENITKRFSTERPLQMKKRAQFLKWQENLTPKDWETLRGVDDKQGA